MTNHGEFPAEHRGEIQVERAPKHDKPGREAWLDVTTGRVFYFDKPPHPDTAGQGT